MPKLDFYKSPTTLKLPSTDFATKSSMLFRRIVLLNSMSGETCGRENCASNKDLIVALKSKNILLVTQKINLNDFKAKDN